eukprot:TRINITY_DN3231_c0_g3_i5.p1 TRINITY_DN3231_c0_g3~~TRINITY_DN3231_c0_g3_i5.p1  ORF type:complete len:3059 (-),score=575.29 TRINITY_DN3231_c0_g3_i5:95-9271(-)
MYNSRPTLQFKNFSELLKLKCVTPWQHCSLVFCLPGEGEAVPFFTHVQLKTDAPVQEFLGAVETEMRNTVATLLSRLLPQYSSILSASSVDFAALSSLLEQTPAQIAILAFQIVWTQLTEGTLANDSASSSKARTVDTPAALGVAISRTDGLLAAFAGAVLRDLTTITRRKYEHLITELVHQRDVLRILLRDKVKTVRDFAWLYFMRFYFDPAKPLFERLTIEMANARIPFGYEYLGVVDRLVQTPLTDRAFLTLTQGLAAGLGGSPFGPAGTGKTETVKALGAAVGRFVLVFNCDDTFDFKAMGRIFLGLCQCGAWGCFDEFNRLEERILSAVSQQIQSIQTAIKGHEKEVELLSRRVKLNVETAIFITMNPNYAGRRNLPDNLKQLFRSIAMVTPDRQMIAQVMLYTQGFRTAETLAAKVTPLFRLCEEQLSRQKHYDFALRALKSVLVSAGNLQRQRQATSEHQSEADEQDVLLRSISDTVTPKLVGDDVLLLRSLIEDVFPTQNFSPPELKELKQEIISLCQSHRLEPESEWMTKVLQLSQLVNIHHGVMLVGASGTGKTRAWRTLLAALDRLEKVQSEFFVIDPKALTKDTLYGVLDATTRDWRDGVFTSILRKIVENPRGESGARQWIVFDGDVDPEWVENLNSVLDDTKLFTLPNGERLPLPHSVRIIFEVQDLQHATLATVSRCGMVWFSAGCVSSQMLCRHLMAELRAEDPQAYQHTEGNGALLAAPKVPPTAAPTGAAPVESEEALLQRQCADLIEPLVNDKDQLSLVFRALHFVANQPHIMPFSEARMLSTLFALLRQVIVNMLEFHASRPGFPLPEDILKIVVERKVLLAVLWAFGGDMAPSDRVEYAKFLATATSSAPTSIDRDPEISLLDFEVRSEDGEWVMLRKRVQPLELEAHRVLSTDIMVPTVDTLRNSQVIQSFLAQQRPLLLCGPPGSGKTMSLSSSLQALPDYESVLINFSSASSPSLLHKTFDRYCIYKTTPSGIVLQPLNGSKRLVIFCDEINLPELDAYGTSRIITLLRQLILHGGFWRASDLTWIRLERIHIVGACNPPTDAGRVPLPARLLRHMPLIFIGFPAPDSLQQIYGTFLRGVLRLAPQLRSFAGPTTDAMVEVYSKSQEHFTPDQQPHYIYSPRELTRWVRAIYTALVQQDKFDADGLVRLWAHEGLRLFSDRLVTEPERAWTLDLINGVAARHFVGVNLDSALRMPILFSSWLNSAYVSVDRDQLRQFMQARLKTFCEEHLDVPLVMFNSVLDHALRIDRVIRQPQGHLLLIGVSGAGKTVLSKFVAWSTGLSVFQIKASKRYTAEDFNEDLRTVMKRCGCRDEKVCFVFDESNILESSFLERMNALLASGDVPGLFEGEQHAALMQQVKEASSRQNQMLDSDEELYRFFIEKVQRNLHVIFTMNPASSDFRNRSTASPALFNRCVVDWFGDWTLEALIQTGSEFTKHLDLDDQSYSPPSPFPQVLSAVDEDTSDSPEEIISVDSQRQAIVAALVHIHRTVAAANRHLQRLVGRSDFVSPRHFLDLIAHFVSLFREKRSEVEDQQRHLSAGLAKLRETQEFVSALQVELGVKRSTLHTKEAEANRKLQTIIEQKQSTEETRRSALQLEAQLKIETAAISERRAVAMTDLEKAEPAVREAEAAVQGIRRQNMDEIRNMNNPPAMIRSTCEALVMLIDGTKPADWDYVRRTLKREDFLSAVIGGFDPQKITAKTRSMLQRDFFSSESFTLENATRASQACGPLFKWMQAQFMYSEILDRVKPLRDEVAKLEAESGKKQAELSAMQATLAETQVIIDSLTEEYKELVKETERIKEEMGVVEKKCERSIALLSRLTSERQRWEVDSAAFQEQMATVAGDALLSSAFATYAGAFDHAHRHLLLQKWRTYMTDAGLRFRENLVIAEYISTADERLKWAVDGLPTDELCTENATILSRFVRYPLIVDPSAQCTTFLTNFHRGKIILTSFYDESFLRHLESALRFGTVVVVQDVDTVDPILFPLLNKEIHRVGGRSLVRLGDQEIDFSPGFSLYLTTRDPHCVFSPDVCSRVTFVNFTITQASLQTQCLDAILKSESPEVEAKRIEVVKAQGEYRRRLRLVEGAVLSAISEAQGNILNDDAVLATLETLTVEAADVSAKAANAELVIADVQAAVASYQPLAKRCSQIYFALEQLAQINHFYQFSLAAFLAMFKSVLVTPKLKSVTDRSARLEILTATMFSTAYENICHSLLNEDKLLLAVLLSVIRLMDTPDELPSAAVDFLVRRLDEARTASAPVSKSATLRQASSQLNLTPSQQRQLLALSHQVSGFQEVTDWIQQEAWSRLVADSRPEDHLPSPPQKSDSASEIVTEFQSILVLAILRPDRLSSALSRFVGHVFARSADASASPFTTSPPLDLTDLLSRSSHPSEPILLCARPGFDPSAIVDDVAHRLQRQCVAVAIGSAEGYDLAEKALKQAPKSGSWVLLKNVHLAPQWLAQLEKRLTSYLAGANPNFRLLITLELPSASQTNRSQTTANAIPVTLIRQSRVLIFESPPGVCAQLQHAYSSVISAERAKQTPHERSRLYLLVAWLHAVVLQRLRHTPQGWSKPYEFNEADQRCALALIDSWLDIVSQKRSNIDPKKLPWQAIQTLLAQSVYGGRIDNDYDAALLESLIQSVFVPESFDPSFDFAPDPANSDLHVAGPSGPQHQDCVAWVQSLAASATESPGWCRLPSSAETLLKVAEGRTLLRKLLRLRAIEEDALAVEPSAPHGTKTTQGSVQSVAVAPWLSAQYSSLTSWLEALPSTVKLISTVPTRGKEKPNPLIRFLAREAETATVVLKTVRSDLSALVALCRGQGKLSDQLRSAGQSLARDVVPGSWWTSGHTASKDIGVSAWIADLGRRISQLSSLADALTTGVAALEQSVFWFGGFYAPEAFITATRQSVSRARGWSMETLELVVECPAPTQSRSVGSGFLLNGLALEGAQWDSKNGVIDLCSSSAQLNLNPLPPVLLSWRQVEAATGTSRGEIRLPIYSNAMRTQLLLNVQLPVAAGVAKPLWYQYGVAVHAWSAELEAE